MASSLGQRERLDEMGCVCVWVCVCVEGCGGRERAGDWRDRGLGEMKRFQGRDEG